MNGDGLARRGRGDDLVGAFLDQAVDFVRFVSELEGGRQGVPDLQAALGGAGGIPIGDPQAGKSDGKTDDRKGDDDGKRRITREKKDKDKDDKP